MPRFRSLRKVNSNPSPKPSRKGNQNRLRRAIAAAKQTPLHMTGLEYHPGSSIPVSGQLDRAKERQKEHAERYPRAPRYVTKIGSN